MGVTAYGFLDATKARQSGARFRIWSQRMLGANNSCMQRPSYPGSDWIDYADAPPGMTDRVFYELMIACCREDWEKTRDPVALFTARVTAHMYRQWEPLWLRDAIDAGFLQRRSPKQQQRYAAYVEHRMRWTWVKRYHEIGGLTWPEAYEKAAERLASTSASGSADTMKKSYLIFQRRRRTRPAEKALSDWLDAKDPQPPPEPVEKDYLLNPPKVTWER
jgi:hypothetical protein